MIEGMVVYITGVVTGVIVSVVYFRRLTKSISKPTKDELFDPGRYLTPDKKYFTNKSLDDEGGK